MDAIGWVNLLALSVLTIIFLGSGIRKLCFNHNMILMYPKWAQPLSGAWEVAAALLLHWPASLRPMALLMVHCFLGSVLHVVFFGSARADHGREGRTMWQREGVTGLKPFAIAFVNAWFLCWATPASERAYGLGPPVAVHFLAMGLGYLAALVLFAVGPSKYEAKKID